MWNGEDWTTVEPPNPHLTIMDLNRYMAEMGVTGQVFWELGDYAERERRIDKATGRAKQLLAEYLTDEQLESWEKSGYIRVMGNKSHLPYAITKTLVYRGDGRRYCLEAKHRGIPREDVVLARKLLIETDEYSFLADANVEMIMPDSSISVWVAGHKSQRKRMDDNYEFAQYHYWRFGED